MAATPEEELPPIEAQLVQAPLTRWRSRIVASAARANTHSSPGPREAVAGLSSKTSAPAGALSASQAIATNAASRRTVSAADPLLNVLAHETGDEARVVARVAPPQAARLLDHPEQ